MKIFTLEEQRWNKIKERVALLETTLSSGVFSGSAVAQQKEHGYFVSLLALYNKYVELHAALNEIASSIPLETDESIKKLLIEEQTALQHDLQLLEQEGESLVFVAGDPEENSGSIFIEMRIGTGGMESSLFCADLARMYTMYANKKRWKISVASCADTEVGGVREIVLHVEGKAAFPLLQYESGVHRVQRVPETEASGRIHTSTATVAILPEVDEVAVSILPSDLRIDTFRAGGAGGQHVNKTDSAVRITHIPTGVVVACQDERSQHKNKSKAMKVLQAKLFALEKEKNAQIVGNMRKEMVASADRSDKIRTYNFPQNRVTDHRIGCTLNKLDYVMEGDLDELLFALADFYKKDRTVHPFIVALP